MKQLKKKTVEIPQVVYTDQFLKFVAGEIKKCQMEFQNEEQNQQGFSTGVAGFDRQGKNFH